MPERAIHKGRERWMRWSGTPRHVANVAREVEAQVGAGDSGPTPITIKVTATAWESDFSTPDDFQGGIDDADISDIDAVEIRSSMAGRKVTVAFARPPKPQGNQSPRPEVVSLSVAGPDRDWVRDATQAVARTIQPGVPQSEKLFRQLIRGSLGVLGVGLIILIVGGITDYGGVVTAGWIVALTGIGLLVLGVLPESVLPRLEILPEGKQTRRSRLRRWGRREVGWWVRNLLLLAVGAGLTLLAQQLSD
jgi:hypothetical protein